MQSILVCDDDCKVLESVKWQLEQCKLPRAITIKTFKNTEELLFFLGAEKEEPHVLLMDIRFEGAEDGITAVKKISEINKKAVIIFISAYDDYYEDVYEAEHVYFLKKPFDVNRLQNALDKAMQRVASMSRELIVIAKKGEVHKLEQEKILYIENRGRKVEIHAEGDLWDCNKKIDEVEQKLSTSFVRCHQSYVVNLNKVSSLVKMTFVMQEGSQVPVSRNYYKEVKERFLDTLK